MNQYWPFVLTGILASAIPSTITVLLTNGLRHEMRAGFLDVKNQINHLIDLHIDHAERITWLETKAGKK
jgi:hypothetical protein